MQPKVWLITKRSRSSHTSSFSLLPQSHSNVWMKWKLWTLKLWKKDETFPRLDVTTAEQPRDSEFVLFGNNAELHSSLNENYFLTKKFFSFCSEKRDFRIVASASAWIKILPSAAGKSSRNNFIRGMSSRCEWKFFPTLQALFCVTWKHTTVRCVRAN